MAKPRVYVETTVPSFYHEERTAPAIVARREWTQRWWDSAPDRYELVTSPAVLDELTGGIPERISAKRLALIRGLPLLPVESAIAEIVQGYIRHKVMPADPGGDALHLALAFYHKCDFLVTWNCQHPCKCEQVRTHPPCECHARSFRASVGDTLGATWR